jgi:hypothetical protein
MKMPMIARPPKVIELLAQLNAQHNYILFHLG